VSDSVERFETYIYTYIHTYTLIFTVLVCIYLLTYFLTYLLTDWLAYLLTYLLIYLLTYLLTDLLTYWLTYLFIYLLTYYFMQQSPWEANSISASQKFPCILWNPKVNYYIHKCPSPVSILSQINTVHTAHPTSWRSILILSSCLRLGLPSGIDLYVNYWKGTEYLHYRNVRCG